MKILTVDGHLGKDAAIMTTPKGTEYITLSLANTTYVKGTEKTTWYNVTFFDVNSLRNRIPYLKKGSYVGISGLPDEQAYLRKDGSLDIQHNLLGDRIEFLKVGKRDENANQQNGSYSQAPQNNYPQRVNEQQNNGYINKQLVQTPNPAPAQPTVQYQAPQPSIPTYQPQQAPQPTMQTNDYQPQTSYAPSSVDTGDDLPF